MLMNKNCWVVYCHTQKETGKKYFGITSRGVKIRWGKEGYCYHSSPYFYNAIQKYGWNSFYHDVLFENLSEDRAKEYERLYIGLYKTNIRKYGYNCTLGGDGTVGLHFSEEARKKRGTDKSVVQLTMRGEYVSTYKNIHEAARLTNSNFSHISSCCNCRYKREKHNGFLWMFLEDYEKWDKNIYSYFDRFEDEPTKHPRQPSRCKSKAKRDFRVVVFDIHGNVLKYFENISDASNSLGISYATTRKYLSKHTLINNEFVLYLYNQPFCGYLKKKKKDHSIKIARYELDGSFNKMYRSYKEVAEDGYTVQSVRQRCRTHSSSYRGYLWGFYQSDSYNILNDYKKSIKPRRKIIQYDKCGNIVAEYCNLKDATIACGLNSISAISNVLNGRAKTAAGYLWKYSLVEEALCG